MKKTSYAKAVSPCEDCARLCNYTQCRDYRLWLNRCWNRYRRWQALPYKAPAKERRNVWRYDSPVLLHDFVEQGPCVRCPSRQYCGDEESCSAYDAWVHLRWELLRRKLGAAPN